MLSTPRPNTSRRHRIVAALLVIAAFLRGCGLGLNAQTPATGRTVVAPSVLTSFDQIWQLPEAEQRERHGVRLDFVVYYYDPQWQALWGRCGEADSYLSLGTKTFPIKSGQRILVEGTVQPSSGMRVEDPKVTLLAETAPVEVFSTNGQVASAERFNKRLVTLEGYVDRQVVRDASHLEYFVVAEGQSVLVQLLLGSGIPIPQLRGMLVRFKGVYFARNEPTWTGPRVEVWVQRSEDIEVLGSLERDERFNLPATPLGALADAPPGRLVHVTGTLELQQEGKPGGLRDGAAHVILQTAQNSTSRDGERVEAIGFPVLEAGQWVLQQALLRDAPSVITTLNQFWQLPDAEQRKPHRLRLDITVYYYDPVWKSLWGGSAGSDDYIPLGDNLFPIKAGQRILIEGSSAVNNGFVIDQPKVTILEQAVPLKALETHGRIGDTEALNKRFVVVEGYVDRQLATDKRHVELDLTVEGRPIVGRMLLPENVPAPKWEGALLRIKGVYAATSDPTGGLPIVELWCAGAENVEVLGSLDQDKRFELPPTPIENLATVPPGTLVHVVGVARAQRPGKALVIRDETGQVALHTVQARAVQLGEAVEAIGIVVQEGAEWNLREGLFRKSKTALPAPVAGLPNLRLTDQLRELSSSEAARSYPVQLSGIVIWTHPAADFFYLRDASGGVCVYRPPEVTRYLVLGTKVTVTGVSASGKFTPVVLASSVVSFSTFEMPEAPPVTLEQALTGIEEGHWVSMSGYVRAVERDGPWARFELTTSAGEFRAMLSPSERWAKLPGSIVRMRGVCTAQANSKRQLTGIQLWVPSPRFVEIEEAAPADPFGVAARPIASLRQFSSLEALNRRVKVSGVVIHQAVGRLIHIQEGTESLLVLSRGRTQLALGDRIEAVGLPGRENSRVVLREAIYRRVIPGPEPVPTRVGSLSPIDAELDGRLVRVEGSLLDLGAQENGVRLINQQDGLIFEALLETQKDAVPASWVPGSRVALTGVYEIQFDEYRRPHAVRIQLRTLADVQVLEQAPWWTAKRALGATGVLAVGLVLGFGWVLALRRRVQQQTDVIREQVENEKAARLDAALSRASKLESLGVLAGGIAHDFNNLLTVVIGNLSLAKLDPRIEPDTVQCLTESERAAARAKDLTQQLLTFAKGGEPMRRATRLPDTVREAAQFALHGSKVRCEFDIAPDLWPADVDRGQTGQVVHNIIINATQAMPAGGLVQVVMRNDNLVAPREGLVAGRYVKISFTDSGSGISPENLPRIFDPYFTTKRQGSGLGLATVYSIVKKHQGHVEVSSKPGLGTTFHVWLPAARNEAVPTMAEAGAAQAKTGRVLFMDDEAAIRSLGVAVLKRRGFAVTAVSDGAAVVSEYAAASAAGRPFDLVVLDLTVPGGMGGGEAMEKLRAMNPQVRAIVSSGYSSDPVMANFRAHGFLGRVPKPYQADELIRAVDEVLRDA